MPLARLTIVAALLGSGAACGWFSGGDQTLFLDPSKEDVGPTCRPKGLDARGTPPWKEGHVTAQGWKVASVDASHMEYVRIGFEKEDAKTVLEVGYNRESPDAWSTEKYRLMPAPEEEPPEELLNDAIGELRAFAAGEEGPPFVRRSEGVVDPYQGLPPCED